MRLARAVRGAGAVCSRAQRDGGQGAAQPPPGLRHTARGTRRAVARCDSSGPLRATNSIDRRGRATWLGLGAASQPVVLGRNAVRCVAICRAALQLGALGGQVARLEEQALPCGGGRPDYSIDDGYVYRAARARTHTHASTQTSCPGADVGSGIPRGTAPAVSQRRRASPAAHRGPRSAKAFETSCKPADQASRHVVATSAPGPATSAPGLGSPLPHLRRDCANPATSAPGLGQPLTRLHRD